MHSKISEHLLLIPIAHGLPAVQAYLETQPDDGSLLTTDELQALARLAMRVIRTSELLLSYALTVGGQPVEN